MFFAALYDAGQTSCHDSWLGLLQREISTLVLLLSISINYGHHFDCQSSGTLLAIKQIESIHYATLLLLLTPQYMSKRSDPAICLLELIRPVDR